MPGPAPSRPPAAAASTGGPPPLRVATRRSAPMGKSPSSNCGEHRRVRLLDGRDNIVLALDKDVAELSTSVLPDDEYAVLRDKHHATEYAHQLPWPAAIEVCLS